MEEIECDPLAPYLLLYFLERPGMKRENKFQSNLIDELEELFPGCIVLKTNPNYIQGFPDLLILFKNHWAALECKRSEHEVHQPNQDYYVDILGKMSYASFIFPENKEEVLDELQQTFKPRRSARVSKRQ